MSMDKTINNNISRSETSDEMTSSNDLKADQRAKNSKNNHELNPKSESSIIVISILIVSSILLIGYLSIYWAIPVYLINHFQSLYQQQGDDYQLNIGRWSFTPHRGELILEDVLFQYPNDQKHLDSFHLVIDPTKLFESQLVIETLKLTNWQLAIDINNTVDAIESTDAAITTKNIAINGYVIDATSLNSTAKESELAAPVKQNLAELITGQLPQNWSIQWAPLKIENLQLQVNQNNQQQLLKSESYWQVEIDGFNSMMNSPVSFSIMTDMNKALWHQGTTAGMSVLSGRMNQSDDELTEIQSNAQILQEGVYQANLLRPTSISIKGNINTDDYWLSTDLELAISGVQLSINNNDTSISVSDISVNNLVTSYFDERLSLEFSTLNIDRWRSQGFDKLQISKNASNLPLAAFDFDLLDINEFNLSLNPRQPMWNWQLQHITDHMQIHKLRLQHANTDQVLIDRLRFHQINMETNDGEPSIALQQLILAAGQYLPKGYQSSVAALGQYQIDSINMDRHQLKTGVHQIRGIRANIERSAQGKVQWFSSANLQTNDADIEDKNLLAVNSISFQDIYGDDEVVSVAEIEPLKILPSDIVYFNNKNAEDNTEDTINRDINYSKNRVAAVVDTSSSKVTDDNKNDLLSNLSANPLTPFAQQISNLVEQFPFSIEFAGIRLQSSGFNITQSEDKDADASIGSRIIFIDKGLIPAKTYHVKLNQGQISAFDSQQYQKPLQFYLQSQFDEFNENHFLINSAIKFDDIEIDALLKTEKLNLLPLNPYIQEFSGYRLRQGLINNTSIVKIKQGKVHGNNHVILEDIKLAVAHDQKVKGLEQHLALPLDMTLALMADKERKVDISFPMSGSLLEPNVSLLGIAQKATTTALKKGSLIYLKQALQPYGSFVSVANFVGKELFAIRLDKLLFAENSTELNEQARQQLQKVEQLMQTKSNLRLVVCPAATRQEQQLLGTDWAALADQRGLGVKRFFVNQRDSDGQLITDRITLCEASIADQPQIVLGLE